MTSLEIRELIEKLTDEINVSSNHLLSKYPITEYIELFNKYPKIASYSYLSHEVKDYADKIKINSNNYILQLYNQLLLINFIARNFNNIDVSILPNNVKILYKTNFNRIFNSIKSRREAPDFFMYTNDKFLKDLGICSLKIIPAGSQKIDVSMLPRRFLFRKGGRQLIDGLIFILFELGGIKPLYDMHTDSHDPDLLSEFNPDGWTQFYINVANLLKLNQEMKGIYGIGWFFDPGLHKISPRLAYLNKLVTTNGGKIFYIGPGVEATRNALAKSPTRKKLYDEGAYTPTDYMAVWARNSLIDWADYKALL